MIRRLFLFTPLLSLFTIRTVKPTTLKYYYVSIDGNDPLEISQFVNPVFLKIYPKFYMAKQICDDLNKWSARPFSVYSIDIPLYGRKIK
jgi:hypothetical protein